MEDIRYSGGGNVLQSAKYAKPHAEAGHAYAAAESAAHGEALRRFHAAQGHGFAAEQANDLIDTIEGRDAAILGNDNAKDGADRMVDGRLIQTKYCASARASVDAAFRDGQYRYLDGKGQAMQLEVPSDQYEEAVEIMRERIAEGKVPGLSNPKDAEKIVRKGNVDYETACSIAKAGTIDSLLFDAAHGSVIAASAFGISAAIVFARALWDGESTEKAVDMAVCAGLKAGGVGFLTSVVTAQLARTGAAGLLEAPASAAVRALPGGVRKELVQLMEKTPLIYGGAGGDLTKLAAGQLLTGAVVLVTLSAGDITNFFRGRISASQLFKDVMTVAGGLGGSAAGAVAGGMLGALVPIPGAVVVGEIAGAALGGAAAGGGTHALLSHFIEDDAAAMLRILNDRLIPLVRKNLLSEEELGLVLDDLRTQLVRDKLLDMYASDDREAFADALLAECIRKVTCWRVHIRMPTDAAVLAGVGRLADMAGDEARLAAYFTRKKVDTVGLGQALLGRTVSKAAADKAWFVTKQMNLVGKQQEAALLGMKESEAAYAEKRRTQREMLMKYREEIFRETEEK